ncbi:MAG: redoxin domain-containing protein [Deltaproteobacteria bacterium]|nr:redoxin domain-containing protein [Deltaproteobacteria bacterium]
MKYINCLCLSLMLFCSQAFCETSKAAPQFSLPDENGQMVSLSDYKGRYVVIEWMNPDCPFVQRHYQEQTMANLYNKYHGENVAWIAINSTHYMSEADNLKWKEKYKVAYPILMDKDGAVGKSYGAKTTPHMFVINPFGEIAYQGAIDNDKRGSMELSERTNYIATFLDSVNTNSTSEVSKTDPYGCSVKYAG